MRLKKQLQNKSNTVLVHAWDIIAKYVYFVIPVGLSRAGLSQPKGRVWPAGRAKRVCYLRLLLFFTAFNDVLLFFIFS